jgi:ice-binding like protein/Big-like domain-containing protein
MKSGIRNFAVLSLAVAFASTAVASVALRTAPGSQILGKRVSSSILVNTLVAPNLGAAGGFAVLAASTVTNGGASIITGNLGLSPGISVTGFPPGILNGTLHIADPTSAAAQLALTAAYIDAAGRTLGAIGLAGNLGGQTLAPGLYKSASSLEISSGDLTLDAQGDANAVYIFEMGSTLVTTTGRKVILAGGAQAANIYWQVGSSATLGVSSVFKGNILALASITVNNGASVEGRLLARTAAVTLDNNAVVVGAAAVVPVDVIAPVVSAATPASGAIGVAVGSKIVARFSEAMSASSINAYTFVLNHGAMAVSGTVSYASGTAVFTPSLNLSPQTSYTATITTGAVDLAGNHLAANMVWSFTTAAAVVAAPPEPLGGLGTFAILAGSTVTSTGATTITGDLGVSPGIAVTGFPPAILIGTLHIADPSAAQAQLALTTAYNDAAGRSVGAIAVAGNLGGQTLAPGVYKSTSSLEISSGDLTLDAKGNANAVFIFEMASTLVTTTGRKVILAGGAQAANIIWQVGSSATLGTSSVFKGNILAMASITVNTGVSVEGRLLARTGAVTLDSNVVVMPAGGGFQPISVLPSRM